MIATTSKRLTGECRKAVDACTAYTTEVRAASTMFHSGHAGQAVPMLTAVTRNLGHRTSGEEWLRDELSGVRAPDVAFVQEVLPGFLSSPPAGYRMVAGRAAPKSAVGRTSVLLIRDGIGALDDSSYPGGGRHLKRSGRMLRSFVFASVTAGCG